MKKRLLSLILAICMTAALLPTFALSASALEVNEAIGYYFYINSTTNEDLAETNVLSSMIAYNADEGRYWKYDANKNILGGVVKNSALKSNNLYGQTRKGQYMALDIAVPENGKYTVEYKYNKVNGGIGGKGDVYIIPGGTTFVPGNTNLTNFNDVVAVGTKIASVDYSSGESTSVVTKATPLVETIDLMAGDNVLLFHVTGAGEHTTASSHAHYFTFPNSLTLTLIEKASSEDESLTNAFKPDDSTATAYAPSVDAVTTVTGTSATKQTDGSYKMVAPATDANGNEFLYWAKGLSLYKRIVSLEREFTYTPATGDRNYLIPVYAPQSATGNEYYNANGQLIDCAEEAPALPSMAGYGAASGWAQYEDTNIYVAEYNNKTQPDDVEVTVNGEKSTVPYGTDITCTAEDKDANNKPFKCWTKSDINGKAEIVSCDKNYTFKAWENCTVTAVYEDHTYTGAKMKIIIDSFTVGNETSIMAEFIGITNAVEKGIMFGTQKIAMTALGNQFTVTADKNGTYKGYAIVGNEDDGYTLITDGEAVISGLAE